MPRTGMRIDPRLAVSISELTHTDKWVHLASALSSLGSDVLRGNAILRLCWTHIVSELQVRIDSSLNSI